MQSLKYLYKIGRGPSSSHTMGPDKAARYFKNKYAHADSYKVILYGSLSSTGKGHKTDEAILDVFEDCDIGVKLAIFSDSGNCSYNHDPLQLCSQVLGFWGKIRNFGHRLLFNINLFTFLILLLGKVT